MVCDLTCLWDRFLTDSFSCFVSLPPPQQAEKGSPSKAGGEPGGAGKGGAKEPAAPTPVRAHAPSPAPANEPPAPPAPKGAWAAAVLRGPVQLNPNVPARLPMRTSATPTPASGNAASGGEGGSSSKGDKGAEGTEGKAKGEKGEGKKTAKGESKVGRKTRRSSPGVC